MTALANFSHQDRLFDPDKRRPVTLIGAGSVGSFAALALAKMGVDDITVYDADVVASHNAPMSLYRQHDLGRPKVDALAELIRDLTGVVLRTKPAMYAGERLPSCSVVACVDTMKARSLIWKQVKANPAVDVLIETRTGGAYVEVLSIDPHDREEGAWYEALLYDDAQASRQMCGRHGVSFSSLRAASIVSANLARYWMGGEKAWRIAERCDTLQQVIRSEGD